MSKKLERLFLSGNLQVGIYLLINCLFIFKYLSRVANYGIIASFCYCGLIILTLYGTNRIFNAKFKANIYKIFTFVLLGLIIISIITILHHVNPYQVKVDRWSAVTFFLDHLFNGNYPYAAHTHTSVTNFPSPFPFWYVINLPFYLLNDVGIGLIFFLLLIFYAIYIFTSSFKSSFLFILLLALSPAYWWEVWVRSDGLSNAILVYATIIVLYQKQYTLQNKPILNGIISGFIAATRLSAILPLAIYYFRDFFKLKFSKKLLFILLAIFIPVLFFLPFIFWGGDTSTFMGRNPFMSQTSYGSRYILVIMILIGILFSLTWKDIRAFMGATSLFILLFMLISQTVLLLQEGRNDWIESHYLDVSYFTLCFPYCLTVIVSKYRADSC